MLDPPGPIITQSFEKNLAEKIGVLKGKCELTDFTDFFAWKFSETLLGYDPGFRVFSRPGV